ncbi:MAG: ATP:cob(I)alamin adenosyltransferase, partial [Betaproteobacteria bacterium]|nr:ATP:cob(I)alamin adenosyltransferase [Betaproteobacteria bacterium]
MGNRLSKIYTRTGDDGTTGLGDGSRVRKDSLRIEAIGAVDELNSALGVLAAEPLDADIADLLMDIQHRLFDLGGELSVPGFTLIKAEQVTGLERALDAFN